MSKLSGYVHSLRAYLATAKGGHDASDYGRAVFCIVLTIVAVWSLLVCWR